MKKKWIILLYSLVMAAAVGASIYEFYRKGSLDQSNLTRTILILAGALLGMVKNLNRNKVSFAKKQELYEKTYASHIGNAFSNMPKEKKVLFRSLDDFNDDKYTSAIKKLEGLNESCRALSEQRAIAFFLGLNYDRMGEYDRAIPHYERCLSLGGDAAAANNLASCYGELGDLDRQWENLLRAVRIDPNYATGHNNIGQFLVKLGEYEDAIEPLLEAYRLDCQLGSALSGLAICYAMTDQRELYEKAIHRMVGVGKDPTNTKNFIRHLNPEFKV